MILFNLIYHRLPPLIIILPLLKLTQRVHLRLRRDVLIRLVLPKSPSVLRQLVQRTLILVHHSLTRLNQRPCRFVSVDGLHARVGDLAVRGGLGRGVVQLGGSALRVGLIGLERVSGFETDLARLGVQVLKL